MVTASRLVFIYAWPWQRPKRILVFRVWEEGLVSTHVVPRSTPTMSLIMLGFLAPEAILTLEARQVYCRWDC